MKRIAPKTGYNFPEKEQYREKVYEIFTPEALHKVRTNTNSHLLVLPSIEGLELDVAISKGFPEDKIIAIDSNPDIINNSAWVTKYPRVKKYYGNIRDGLNQFEDCKDVTIAAANLDLCGQVSNKTIETLNGFFSNTTVEEGAVCSVTIMRAREKNLASIEDIGRRNQGFARHQFKELRHSALFAYVDYFDGNTSKILYEGFYQAKDRVAAPMSFVVAKL